MKKVTFILVAILIFGVSNASKADSPVDKKKTFHGLNIGIPTHAMLALAGPSSLDVDFEAVAAGVAGGKVIFKQTNKTELWLNYSSIVSKSKSNTVSAAISELPKGLVVDLVVSPTATKGKIGRTGKGYTKPLTTGGVEVVAGIGSCYTGSGMERGHSLIYKVSADEDAYAEIASEKYPLTVTYTITEL